MKEEYSKAKPLLDAALTHITQLIESTFKDLGDPDLIRARIDKARIKSVPSLQRKAKAHGWSNDEVLEKTSDLVGHRVVCHNLQDVERAADFLEKAISANGINVNRNDFTENARKGGYRAVHLDIKLPVQIGPAKMDVGCEIQIRSLLQHAWAELSRADIYTREEEIDPMLLKSMEKLSTELHSADATADHIRTEIAQPREGKPPETEAELNGPTLAFIYRRAFGADPPDYLIQSMIGEFAGTKIRSDGLEALIKNTTFMKRLKATYHKQFNWDPYPEQLFRWVVYAAVRGTKSALRLARREGKSDWEEVDAVYRREVRSE